MSAISDTVFRFVFRTTSRLMPRHIKRLVLWCAVYSQVRYSNVFSDTNPDIKTIKSIDTNELIDRLKLAEDKNVFLLPMLFGLPARKEMIECIDVARKALSYSTPEELTKLSHQFSQSMPACLRYASRMLISRDFRKLFERRPIGYTPASPGP